MAQKLTPEFPENIKPVRRGLYPVRYERRLNPGTFVTGFAWWTGWRWGMSSHLPEVAASRPYRRGAKTARQDKRWRGLASPPATAEGKDPK